MTIRLHGLVAATHTPFDAAGDLNLSAVESIATHLLRSGVTTAFVAGTTGESHSLTVEERLALARRWAEIARGAEFRVIIHVGANSLPDAKAMAAQAHSLGATAIAALPPSHFKPRSLESLVDWCREIAAAAPKVPFYFYDIPGLTGVNFPTADFLDAAADRIPTLAGVKFSNPDLMGYQRCLRARDGRLDIPWGFDEYLLAALALGARGAVGSTYNFAAPTYHRLWAAFDAGDWTTARAEQYRSVQLIELLARFGFIAATKAVMGFVGVDVGPARRPHVELTADQQSRLRGDLDRLGFFEWVQK
jgi:N-acetylneuraminate lyase